MSDPQKAEKEAPLGALADLIDHWWRNADQPTFHHDGVEYVASIALARFLISAGCQPPGPSIPSGEQEES